MNLVTPLKTGAVQGCCIEGRRRVTRHDPTFSKAAQQEHACLSDGVDDIADLWVVEQEIDELGDLNVIDGDLWLVFTGSDQVLLLGAF
jgi:hypothetical protein